MLTAELQKTLNQAIEDAANQRHEFVTLEHLLHALLDEKTGSQVLRSCGANVDELRREVEQYIKENFDSLPDGMEQSPQPTAAFERALHRALVQAQASGQATIDGGNVLAGMFQEKRSHAVYLMEKQGISRLDVLNYISHGISKVQAYGDQSSEEMPADGEGDSQAGRDPLAKYTIDLIAKAKDNKIDALIGRDSEIRRTIQVLARRRKNNPVYVGDPGVGKTAIAEALAFKIYKGEVPDLLKDTAVYQLDMGSLIAGTRYRGDFEKRLKEVISALRKRPGTILVIDEIHTIVRAGAVEGGLMDASNILKPALATGEIRCIGSTTYPEYKASFERDKALARRFQKIEVAEPSIGETAQILQGLKRYYEEHHEVTYTDEALQAAAELSGKYINDRFLPDKAIDVIDEAGAVVRLEKREDRQVTVHDVEAIVASIAKIPPKTVSGSDKDRLKVLEHELKGVIFGQDHAIEQVARSVKLSRAGLGSPTKPIGCFLFSGPTGVGKTELAKQFARVMGVNFLRFDMSEYMEKHTVSRLIGAPPGYVGFDQGGLLTDAINKTPHAVLVLDEIEKAHPDLFNILLQVMDHATLTDNNGKKADFRNVLLIMTTNAGAREMAAEDIGFRAGAQPTLELILQKHQEDVEKEQARSLNPMSQAGKAKTAVERTFSPEFRNRLDGWVVFNALTMKDVLRIVDKFVKEVVEQLSEKKVEIELTENARGWLAMKGYDKTYGARPMGRLIQQKIKEPLCDEILFGPLEHGGHAVIDVANDQVTVKVADKATS
jgi:ATP-dependent Clp protease ATP-binding subunit ClpA